MTEITLSIDTAKVATAIKSLEGGSGTDDSVVINWIINQLRTIEMRNRRNVASNNAAKAQGVDPTVASEKIK